MPKLADKSNCTGCTACMNSCPRQCIVMKQDANGFWYPKINKSDCINCGACENSCPVIMQQIEKETIPEVFAAYSKNEVIRKESSSGGIFSEIASVILEKHGVIYGAAYNEKFEVNHICIDTIEKLSQLRGAKYAQSDLGIIFIDILRRLREGQYVLFSGTPCQVAGLKKFLKKDYENLICVDFICHGVPSPMAWKKYIEYRMEQDGQNRMPICINLRDKTTGWSNYKYSNIFKYSDEKVYRSLSGENLFMKLFVGDYINRESCAKCHFKGYARMSDITLGDFWGIWDIAPEMDDNKGTSAVLIQSKKGKQLWDEIYENILFKEVSLEQVSQQNPSILISSKSKNEREEVLNLIKEGKFEQSKKLFVVPRNSILNKIKNKMKRIIKR